MGPRGMRNGDGKTISRQQDGRRYSQLAKDSTTKTCDTGQGPQIKTTLSPAVQQTIQNLSLVYLTLLQTLNPLMVRQAHKMASDSKQTFLSSTVVFNTEVAKLLMSCTILIISHGSITKFCSEMSSAFLKNKKETLKVCVPALIYVVQNNLYYFALKRVEATLFSITYQLRILATALLSMLLLRRVFSHMQWGALCISVVGVVLVQMAGSGKAHAAERIENEQFIGLVTTFIMCWTSAFAGVYLEGVLKQSSCDIWTQNIRLSIITLPFAMLTVANDAKSIQKNGLFSGYTWLLWFLVMSSATSGFVVAAVMKYADNIKKSYCQSIALGGTALLSIITGDSQFSLILMIGVGFVIASVFLYTLNPPKVKAQTPEPPEDLDELLDEEDDEEEESEGTELKVGDRDESGRTIADAIINNHKSSRERKDNVGGNNGLENKHANGRTTFNGREMSVPGKSTFHLFRPFFQATRNIAQVVPVEQVRG